MHENKFSCLNCAVGFFFHTESQCVETSSLRLKPGAGIKEMANPETANCE